MNRHPIAVLVLLFAAGCGAAGNGQATPTTTAARSPAATPGGDQPDCSAGSLSEDVPEPPNLPAPVAMTRKEILKAAVNCDYELLQALALRRNATFQYSNEEESAGPDAQPGRYWQEQEAAGERPLAAMVEILSGPPEVRGVEENEGPGTGSDAVYYTWPAAPDPTLYRGYRTTITADGMWLFFVDQS